jgi:hypothetical protein
MTGKVVSHHKMLDHLGDGGMSVLRKAEDLKPTHTDSLRFLAHPLARGNPPVALLSQPTAEGGGG